MQKMSRKQIKEGLQGVPIESLLLGSHSKEKTLTSKQRDFARKVAMGETKAQAYRDAYNSKTTRAKTQGDAGSRLSRHSGISTEIEAYQAAIEASKYRTPIQLREFIIHQLTIHAMNEDINPAQRIKSLELLGKVSEVALFMERKETTIVSQSSDIKERLLAMLTGQATDVSHKDILSPGSKQSLARNQSIDQSINPAINPHDATIDDDVDSLLAEIKGDGCAESEGATPTRPPPAHDAHATQGQVTHTIPHTKSISESVPCSTQSVQVLDIVEKDNATLTSYSLKSNIEDVVIDDLDIKGVGGKKNVEFGGKEYIDVVPPNEFDKE